MSSELHSEMYYDVINKVLRRIGPEVSILRLATNGNVSRETRYFIWDLVTGSANDSDQSDILRTLSDAMSMQFENRL